MRLPQRHALALYAVIVVAALLTIVGQGQARADGPGVGVPWVVSVGDSYISGEAGRWAGNSNASESYVDALGPTAYDDNATGTGEQIPRCLRQAWNGRLAPQRDVHPRRPRTARRRAPHDVGLTPS